MGMMMQMVELCAVRPQVVWTMFLLVLASRQLDWLGSIVLPVAPLEMCEQLLAVVGMVDEKLKGSDVSSRLWCETGTGGAELWEVHPCDVCIGVDDTMNGIFAGKGKFSSDGSGCWHGVDDGRVSIQTNETWHSRSVGCADIWLKGSKHWDEGWMAKMKQTTVMQWWWKCVKWQWWWLNGLWQDWQW